MKIYLASPFFTSLEKRKMVQVLRRLRENYDVHAPYEYIVPGADKMSNKDWGKKVFDEDIKAIQECTLVIALNWGMYSDTGTAW